ncbi:MAG: NADH-quinone oxidoreductase subunit [Actinomycetota bacterium]|jgi:NADH-quinone oxidoreductase subunit J|nr:NADH-quinone oxidoreductase subunit [Actinomycetota bacterium]
MLAVSTTVPQEIIFWILAVSMAGAALRVVTTKNIVHAALYLMVVLAGVAAQYILLAGEYIAVVQVLVYIGAVLVLVLFGIFLTRAPIGHSGDLDNDQRWLAGIVSLFLFGMLGYILNDAFHRDKLTITHVQGIGAVGDSFFSTYVIPFEVVSVLLLAALVGAIVIARRD